jgi:hypothetical protein
MSRTPRGFLRGALDASDEPDKPAAARIAQRPVIFRILRR